jgi:glutamyl-tRNA synthetase
MRNYLLRLGWSHGDEEIIPTEKAIEWFDLDGVGRSPGRFDLAKLDATNAHYLRLADDDRLIGLIEPRLAERAGELDRVRRERLKRGITSLKQRWKTLNELADAAFFYVARRPLAIADKAKALLTQDAQAMLARLAAPLAALGAWGEKETEEAVRGFAEAAGLKVGQVAQPLRAALTGSNASPGVFEVMAVLGREETLARIADVSTPAAA